MSQRIKKAKRRHMIEMFTVMSGYLAFVFVATRLEDLFTSKIVLTLLALAPVLPMALACFVYIRVYRQMDEREKMINANAAGIALMVAVLAATALGFLQSFGVLVIENVMIWFTSFLIIAWGAARFFMGEDC